MSQSRPNPGNSQHRTQIQTQVPIQNPSQAPTQTSEPSSVQGQLQVQNEHLDAQAAVLLNEFLAKTRRLVSSELRNDMICTICSEPFLRGDNPEVPVMLDCSHTFGMNCILKWLSPVSRNGNNSCPNCRKPIFNDWDKMDFPAPHPIVPARRRRTRVSTQTPAVTSAEVRYLQLAAQRSYAATTNASRTLETATYNETAWSAPGSIRRLAWGGVIPQTMTQTDWEEPMADWRQRLHSRGPQRRMGPRTSSQVFRDLDREHLERIAIDYAQRQEARTCHVWIQFSEGVVCTIEQSTDSTAFANHTIALSIINMKDLDVFSAERAAESLTWQRILRTFPRLHTEMVMRLDEFRPAPFVSIDSHMELERLLASTDLDREALHRARWLTRLSDRLVRGAATSSHEAAMARLTERMANLAGPSRGTTASTTRSGAQPAPEEVREARRMDDH